MPERTFQFAIEILRLPKFYPNDTVASVVGRQLVKCGTPIGANVHETENAMTEPNVAGVCKTRQYMRNE